MRFIWLIVIGLLGFPLAASAAVTSKVELPTPQGYVSDYAEILSPQWKSQIRSVCKDLEIKTGVEMIVVTMPSVAPMTTGQDYASNLYEGWRIGTAQQERGILLFTSLQERQAVVVLGRNLLSVVSGDTLDEVSEKFFVPMFRTTNYGENLYRASVLLASVAGRAHFDAKERKVSSSKGFWMNVAVVLVMVFILWRFTRPERRHPFQRWRRGEYWGTGQGGFGGNFGGFGGGMSGNGLK